MIELYGASQIAELCGVTKACVSNWLKRHPETCPQPFAVSRGKVLDQHFWDAHGLVEWVQWASERTDAAAEALRERHARAVAAAEALQARLEPST